MEAYSPLKTAAEKLTVPEWVELVGRSLEGSETLEGLALPTAPSAEFQAAFVGSSGQQAIQEAGLFYRYALEANRTHRGQAIGRLLDFGCGWGRYTRLFLRDVPEEGLYGVDPDFRAIRVCRQHVPYGCFVNTSTRPPLPFRDQFFDVIVAYSVFSHLTEVNAANWIYELSRTLRYGGLLVATTHPIWLLDKVERLHRGLDACDSPWHKTLSQAWRDVDSARAQYERGEIVSSEIREYSDRDGYSDVLVPEKYITDVWGRIMEPLDFVSDPSRIAQAGFVLRKRA